MAPIETLIKNIEEKSKGEITVNFLGGAEVVTPTDQPEAIRNGVVDITMTSATYVNPFKPASMAAGALVQLNAQERRESGWQDLYNEMWAEVGLFCLGYSDIPTDSLFWSTVPIRSLADFQKLPVRAHASHTLLAKELGASATFMQTAEVYTGIERGIVKGYWNPTISHGAYKIYEVTSYGLLDSLQFGGGLPFVMGLGSYNRLPVHLQEAVVDAAIDTEQEWAATWGKEIADTQEFFKTQGTEYTNLPPEEAKLYLDSFRQVVWDEIMSKDPVWGQRLKDFLDTVQ